MSTTVTYKGQTLTTVENQTKTLNTAGTWVEGDFTLTDASLDVSDTTATASDVAQGKVFYSNTGTRTVGTASGGGSDTLGEALLGTLSTYSNSDVVTLYAYAFAYIASLETIHLPNLVSANEYIFQDTGVKYAVFPKYTRNLGWRVFANARSLLGVDIIGSTSGFNQQTFNNDTQLNVLILRGNTVTALTNINAFNNTPFASGKAGGTLYVPSALESSYLSASNWSTILGYATNSIQAIEGSIYETHYADGSEVTA